MNGFAQDVRFSLRMLRRSPGFAAAAVATLALGIGANAAIFSVVRAVLLKPLPFKDSNRLVFVLETVGKEPAPVSFPNYLDWRAQNDVFAGMAAYSDSDFILSGGGRSDRVFGEMVTGSYFPLLGVLPSRGRAFREAETEGAEAERLVVIGDGLWRRRFGGEPDVIGKTIRINNAEFSIAGVAPPGFRGFSDAAELWIPLTLQSVVFSASAPYDFIHSRDIHWHRAIASLKPGVSAERAGNEMTTIGKRISAAYPKENGDRGATVISAHDRSVRKSRTPLLILLGTVILVLLIACANVANLVLARATSRRREFALRRAMGAGRRRLLRQSMTESLVLCSAGAALGLAVAGWGLRLLLAVLPVTVPSFSPVTIDGAVVLFAVAASAVTAALLGILPALESAGGAEYEMLKGGATTTSSGRQRRMGGVLVSAEVAFAVVLMIGAGLLLKSLGRLVQADPGFRPDHLLTMRFYVPEKPFPGDGRNRFGPGLAETVSRLPGVESAAVTMIDPFEWGGIQRGYSVEGHAPISNAESDSVYYQETGPGYFRTMGIPMRAGRDFSPRDDRSAPPVLVVSESFARRYWGDADPIGKRIKFGAADSNGPWIPVVGVARNVKFTSLRQDADAEPVIYGALLQSGVVINMNLVVRTRRPPVEMIPAVRAAIHRFDADVPVYNIGTLEEKLRTSAASNRSYAGLLGGFALLALALCAIGIAGVIGYWVTQRTREIGIRVALGASRRAILRLVVGESARLAGTGVVAGLLAATLLARLLASLLYGVSPIDVGTYAIVAGLFAAVALFSGYVPARRAAGVDPMTTLRDE